MSGSSMKEIKARQKSIQSTMQITKAMELVAISKLRRAKEKVESSRPYDAVWEEAMNILVSSNFVQDSLWSTKREGPTLYIVFAGDRGLAGSYNAGVIRLLATLPHWEECILLPVGRKAIEFALCTGKEILSTDYSLVGKLEIAQAMEIGHTVAKLYQEGKIARIEVVYTFFTSMLTQIPTHKCLLPLTSRESDRAPVEGSDTLMEGDPEELLEQLIPDYLGGKIYQATCESVASEQAARRMAMDTANKNAAEMLEELELQFNRARQAAITQEITEIISGANALE